MCAYGKRESKHTSVSHVAREQAYVCVSCSERASIPIRHTPSEKASIPIQSVSHVCLLQAIVHETVDTRGEERRGEGREESGARSEDRLKARNLYKRRILTHADVC